MLRASKKELEKCLEWIKIVCNCQRRRQVLSHFGVAAKLHRISADFAKEREAAPSRLDNLRARSPLKEPKLTSNLYYFFFALHFSYKVNRLPFRKRSEREINNAQNFFFFSSRTSIAFTAVTLLHLIFVRDSLVWLHLRDIVTNSFYRFFLSLSKKKSSGLKLAKEK